MEELAVLLFIALVVCVFVLPAVAVAKASSARRTAESMEARLRDLEVRARMMDGELRKLRGQTVFPARDPDDVNEAKAATAGPDRWGFGEDDDAVPDGLDRALPPQPPLPPPLPDYPGDVAMVPTGEESTDGFLPPPPPAPPPSDETDGQAQQAARAAVPLSPAFSLEQFMGVKLFAWLGGIALFFGVIFFVKYAFERNLIPPAVRVALGFVTGAGLLAAGLVVHRKAAYQVLAQSFCATGVLILYGVSYAAHAVYHFPAFGPWITLGLMALITAASI